MNNFDNAALTWDENPVHLERSKAIALKMHEKLPLSRDMKALEYGAGTGILSFLLSDFLNHITMMDSSEGMVKVMENKVSGRNAHNLLPVYFNLEQETSDKNFNLIFNQMVLHHITDIQAIFEKFYKMLLPRGYLAIADLYTEDGSFHGEGFDGHMGFDPEELKLSLLKTGFSAVNYETCYTVVRKVTETVNRSYPIFLITASK